jgi:hypothetical protein
MLKEYRVLEWNMEKLDSMVEKINKRALKLNQKLITYTINSESFETIKGENGKTIMKVFDITLDAEPVQITGYTILASINHTYGGGNIIKTLGDIPIPEKYRTIDGVCDHCGTNRRRKETVLLQDSEGNIVQVGKTCLHDYLGFNINDKLKYMDMLQVFEETDFFFVGGDDSYKFAKYISVKDLLNIANLLVKKYGYVKTQSEKMSTKEKALMIYYRDRILFWDEYEKEVLETVTQKDYVDKEVLEALEWIKTQDSSSDYISNLKILSQNEYINIRETGILCSLMACYYNAQNKENQKKKEMQELNNEYVGTVGEKIEKRLKFDKAIEYCTQFGVGYIYLFSDEEGHRYKWSTSKGIDMKDNEVVTVKGTIKDHAEYGIVRQTVLTRCKILQGRMK